LPTFFLARQKESRSPAGARPGNCKHANKSKQAIKDKLEALLTLDSLADRALLVALASTRIAVAFLLLPILAAETVPALVRNSIFLAFGVITLAVQPELSPQQWTAPQWIGLFAREALIGIGMGVLLGAVLWAFETAGQIVDTKAGVTLAQIADPLSGHQTSLSGALLGRLAVYLFMASGGFLLFVGTLVESFAIWPLAQADLRLPRASVEVFEAAFAHFAVLSFLLAAPCLVVLYVIDLALGLVNRYAPQLNLISISMSLKAVGATVIWLLLLGVLVDASVSHMTRAVTQLLPQLQRAFGA
jgi:type III secretion protein T